MELPARDAALERLDRFVGAWELEAIFPNNPTEVLRGGRSVFAWMEGRRLLVQRTEVPAPEAPDSIAIIVVAPDNDAYTQHYFDSRGGVRRYAMTLRGGVWTLLRDRADDSPRRERPPLCFLRCETRMRRQAVTCSRSATS